MNYIKIDRTHKDISKIYALNEEAFPVEERIPSNKLFDFIEQYHCDIYAFYDHDTFIGYTIIMVNHDYKVGYLWYLAIQKEYRNQGYGSKVLQLLNVIYNTITIVLDMERSDIECDNQAQRKQRLQFYLKNGYYQCFMQMSYFNVDYELLCNHKDFDIQIFIDMVNTIKSSNGWNPQFQKI